LTAQISIHFPILQNFFYKNIIFQHIFYFSKHFASVILQNKAIFNVILPKIEKK